MTPISRRALLRRLLAAMSVVVLVVACKEPTPPRPPETEVAISATLTPEQRAVITAMSVEVTGPGITVPIVVTLDVNGATVNGTVRVPTGAGRVFTVRAYDAQGALVASGSSTTTVSVGESPTLVVNLTMSTPSGDVPINVVIGSYAISLSPSPTVTLARGATRTLTATVTQVGGGVVADAQVQWGARNPVIAGLAPGANGTAVLTGGVAGTTDVVVSWRGIAAAITVTVTP